MHDRLRIVRHLPRTVAVSLLACLAVVTGSIGPACAALTPAQLAVIINEQDALSRQAGHYYATQRGIPEQNIIRVSFRPGNSSMPVADFLSLKKTIDSRLGDDIQAQLAAWTRPYRVGCMSITTALAAGFDERFCARECNPTLSSPYFDSDSTRPFTDYGWRPAMLLAGSTLDAVRALTDRGIRADGSNPAGSAYLLSTSDRHRNVRARYYRAAQLLQGGRFRVQIVQSDELRGKPDIMFYFTGLRTVEGIVNNHYRPGAIADHLTSTGGKLTDSSQMSSLEWLQAGATGSYGNVVEPCNFHQKFPRPDIVMEHYLNGDTLIEAYWKSVQWPGQGVFIGAPLAAPFRQPDRNPARSEQQ